MNLNSSIEILEECKISPSQNSVETTKILLTFFDMPWIFTPPVERILFYEIPHPTVFITESILPRLKHSLSLVLRHYFILAGSLMCPPLPMEPYILYKTGDFVTLTIAQSNNEFHHLVQNYPKNASDYTPLVPHLSNEMSLFSSDDDQVPIKVLHPLIALQVTIFPNSGISISWAYRHVAGDGRSMSNFLKSWASLFKSKNDLSVIVQPFHDRANMIDGSNGLVPILCKQWHDFGVSWDNLTTKYSAKITDDIKLHGRMYGTFVLGSREITLLRNWITSRLNNLDEPSPLPYVSTFVVTCAFMWVCLLKTNKGICSNDDSVTHFSFMADCTERFEVKVPKTYIGNCLTFCVVTISKYELLGKNGLQEAAKAIMKKIKELETGQCLHKAERWLPEAKEMISSGYFMSVAGSPKLRVYDTDFGWGKPKKTDVVHINNSIGSITLMESRDEQGGVEVGISLNKIEMEAFTSIFEQGSKNWMP